ncbi:MAG: nuclear transport factor 2 family protein [Candidatus Sericytochromatia bacterium]
MTGEAALRKTVEAWLEAMNAGDFEGLRRLSDPQIEIVGPRGAGKGHALLQVWLQRAGLRLETRKIHVHSEILVADQHGVWTSPDGNRTEADLASLFEIADGRVHRFQRFENLEQALAQAGITSHLTGEGL